ncbi:MAG: Methyltransferase type 12 [Parcubacteria group bacterium GW2011_GWA2_38_13]|nr:MAG: Methyltransferase type 12 [Parcubacteria group bacterium GW2011_GWA2_38_13]
MRNILKEYKIFDIDPKRLRSKKFYKNMLELHEKLMVKFKSAIKPNEQFVCLLCQSDQKKLFLEYRGYSLFECSRCGLVSPNIDFQKVKDQDIYEDEAYYLDTRREILDTYEYRKNTYAPERLKYILEKTKLDVNQINLLDVGCGPGYFIEHLKSMGIKYKGLELTDYLVTICNERSLSVAKTELKDEPDGAYNVITMYDVLEHVSNPLTLFRDLHKKLADTGFVVAYSPHIHSIAFYLLKEKQNTLYPFQHIAFYDAKSLQYVAEKTGFKVHSINFFGLDVIDYFCYRMYADNCDYLEKFKEFMPVMQAIIDKMNLSNHIRVIFKK